MPITLNGTTGIQNVLGSASAPAESNTTSSNTGLYFPTSTTLGLSTNGTAALTIDASQNVGIGTSSPASTLDVYKASDATQYVRTGTVQIYTQANDSTASGVFGTITNHPMRFITNASEKMRIDSSGNVGIGTSSPVRKLQVGSVPNGGGVAVTGSAPNIALSNADTEPNTNTITSIFALATSAGNYSLNAGEAAWLGIGNSRGNFIINPNYSGTGTKDVVIQPSSGNVGIGTDTPQTKLQVVTGSNGYVSYTSSTLDYRTLMYNSGSVVYTGTWSNHPLVFNTNATEQMRISTGGLLLVNTTSERGQVVSARNFGNSYACNFSATALGTAQGQLAGYSFYPTFQGSGDNGPRRAADIWAGYDGGVWGTEYLAFGVYYGASNDSGNRTIERVRINASGNLLVNTTSGSYRITCNGQPGANGYTAWTNYSDERLKENVVDFVGGLSKVLSLRPVSFNYNTLSGYDEETRSRTVSGFIAQELEKICPDMVGKIKINGVEYLDTNLSNLGLLLVNAIKELKAEIDALKGTT